MMTNNELGTLRHLEAERDLLQVRVSALHDVALDLRAMVLGALTAVARFADEDEERKAQEIVEGLLMGQDPATCGALAVPFRQWWQAPMRHPLQVGTLVLSTYGESDCGGEPEEDRETGPVAVGQIISADEYEGQGWTYGVVFGNHTSVYITAAELADLDAYAVAPAPFIAPEGV